MSTTNIVIVKSQVSVKSLASSYGGGAFGSLTDCTLMMLDGTGGSGGNAGN